jgi:hypothetical protein
MKKVNFLSVLAISISLTTFVACTSEVAPVYNEADFTAVVAEAMGSSLSDQATITVDEMIAKFNAINIAQLNGKQKASANGLEKYVTQTTKPGVYPKELEIYFGDEGYTDDNKNTFRGKIYVSVKDIASSVKTYKFSEFSINKNFIEGEKMVEVVEKGTLKISAKEYVKMANGSESSRYSERTRTRIDDNKTENIYTDDSYSITGYTEGVTSTKVKYTLKIDEPLVSKGGFRYFVSGTMVTSTEKGTQHINFGNGEEDNIAISTINDIYKKIELKW